MRIEPQLSIRKIDTTATNRPVKTMRSDETASDNRDNSSISSSGAKLQKAFSNNKSNAILGLESRKEKIEQSKKEFLQRATSEGMDSKEMAERLKGFEEEISIIEQQISQIKIEEQKKTLGVDEEKLEKIKEKQAESSDKTPEEQQKQEAQSFVSLSQGMDNVKSAMSLRQKLSDTARVIERQIATDIGTGSGTSIYNDMLKEVNGKISELSVAIGESIQKLENGVKNQGNANASQDNKTAEDGEQDKANEAEKPEQI